MTFTGTNFIDGVSTVNVGDGITVGTININKAKGNTQLTANITISASAAPGPRNFSVTNSGPGGGTSGAQTFTVIAPQTISVTSAAPATAGYNTNFTVSATATSGLPVAVTSAGACSGSGSGSAVITMLSSSGTCTVYCNQAGNSTYLAAPQVTNTTVAQQATAGITLGSLSQTFDGTAKNASATTAPSGLAVSFAYNGSATAPISAGTYTVVGTIHDLNYQGSATGLFTVLPKQITVAADAKSKVFGDIDPSLTYAVIGTLVSPDVFTGAVTRIAGENVGTYDIQQGTLALGGNYNLLYTGATFTIQPKQITVAADGKSKIYGDVDPSLTYVVTGTLVSPDVFTGAPARTAGENVEHTRSSRERLRSAATIPCFTPLRRSPSSRSR